jgi:SAM-dependent methyltransferase
MHLPNLGLGIGQRLGIAQYVARRANRPRYWWSRIVVDRETEAYIRSLDYQSMAALEISGKKWTTFGFRSHMTAEWPEYDWCAGPVDGVFDIVIAEQVLEHVQQPAAALRNTHAMLADDGVLVLATPFLIRIHALPFDGFRWTPDGLRQLLNECGFENVVTGSWGNRRCVVANFDDWVHYKPWHSLRNEPLFPVVVWAFARKR